MIINCTSPNMRHVWRNHRVELDWLFERLTVDPAMSIRYVNTKEQIADMLNKGSELMHLMNITSEPHCQLSSTSLSSEDSFADVIDAKRQLARSLTYRPKDAFGSVFLFVQRGVILKRRQPLVMMRGRIIVAESSPHGASSQAGSNPFGEFLFAQSCGW